MEAKVTHNPAQSRYELAVEGSLAIAEYRREQGRLVVTHTVVPGAVGGRGVGTALVRGALDSVRAQRLMVVPRCWFVADFVQKHPEYRDLVADAP